MAEPGQQRTGKSGPPVALGIAYTMPTAFADADRDPRRQALDVTGSAGANPPEHSMHSGADCGEASRIRL
jgi:hypothetical protein